jgi:hypothetical protein
MSVNRALIVVVAGVLFAAAGAATAGSLSSDRQVEFFASGIHQFYVWCPGANDFLASAAGSNGQDAQMKLYNSVKTSGKSCWPMWQGRVAGF